MKKLAFAFGPVALAVALCLALAGCGGSSGSSSSSADGASSGGSQAVQSTSASSDAESPSAASSSSEAATSASSSSAASDYTAGNGTLDCEYVTIEVTGQDVWDHSDGTKGTKLLLHITNKTDRNISLDPTLDWAINGKAGYGLIMENPPAGSSVDTYAVWNGEDGSTISDGGITSASGMITVMDLDNDYEVLGRYDFSYTA